MNPGHLCVREGRCPDAICLVFGPIVTAIEPLDVSEAVERLPPLYEHPGVAHVHGPDNEPLLALMFTNPGARGTWLHIRDMQLPAGATLFACSVNDARAPRRVSGPVVGSASFWTDTLPGRAGTITVGFERQRHGGARSRCGCTLCAPS